MLPSQPRNCMSWFSISLTLYIAKEMVKKIQTTRVEYLNSEKEKVEVISKWKKELLNGIKKKLR